MRKEKIGPVVRTRVRTEDMRRLEQICQSEKKSQAEVVRRALLFYLDAYEAEQTDRRESKLEARLRKMEDRLAAIGMRSNIDIGVIYHAIYHNYGNEAPKAFGSFYSNSVKRLQSKRKDPGEKTAVMNLFNELYRKDEPKEAGEEPEKPGEKPEIKRYTVDE